ELLVELESTADSAREPEHDIRVGHRRLDAAAPVRRRSWHGPGRAWPDAERADVVHPRDRAAAGANRLDRGRRQPHDVAAKPSVASRDGKAVTQEADVSARPAHVARG